MPRKKTAHHGWKAARSSEKNKKTTKLALIAVALIVGIIVFGNTIKVINNLFQPLNPQGTARSYHWNGDTNINVVVKSDDLALLSFDPNLKEVRLVKIPGEVYTQVPGGFGSWRISSVFDLGQGEKKPIGPTLLKSSVQNLIGVPIDGYLEPPAGVSAEEFLTDLRQSPLKGFTVLTEVKTDLTPIEVFKLTRGLSTVRFDKVINYDLHSEGLLEESKLADGTDSLVINEIKVDGFVTANLADQKLKDEGVTIAVYNATEHPGLAQKASRMITNMGGDVIIASSLGETKQKSFIFVKPDSTNHKYTQDRLNQIFATCKTTDCAILEKSKTEEFRAQINVVLGEDFFETQKK